MRHAPTLDEAASEYDFRELSKQRTPHGTCRCSARVPAATWKLVNEVFCAGRLDVN